MGLRPSRDTENQRRRHAGARHGAGLSKLTASRGQDGGSAAPLCGKASPFRAVPRLSFSFTRAGRLSLPARVEEDLKDGRPSERQSLSAQPAAEPQTKARRLERNLDKLAPWRAPTTAGGGDFRGSDRRRAVAQGLCFQGEIPRGARNDSAKRSFSCNLLEQATEKEGGVSV